MADLFLGQTCTEAYQFVSAGTAHTFTFGFQADKAVFTNTSQWTSVASNLPISVWLRNQTAPGSGYQQQVISDTVAGSGLFNFLTIAADGFTVADTSGGVPALRALIAGVTQADPCVITTTLAHGFQTGQMVRITDLGNVGVVNRGMGQINNNRFLITVLNSTSFSLRDPITDEPIDSTGFTAWIAGGRLDIETRVISLNNPAPYIGYIPDPFKYDPITYKLTAGTAVMGSAGNVFTVEVYKFGSFTNLGQLV